jgi:hypothetical protein
VIDVPFGCIETKRHLDQVIFMGDSPQSISISLHPNPNSKEAIEFYRRLGMCIGSWAFVDRRLYQIFHHATGFEQRQSAFLYYRNRAFNQRLRMVDDAVKIELPKEEFANEWWPLHDESVNLSHTRNIFAHHPTLRVGTSRDGKALDIYSIYVEPYERVLNNDYPGLLGKNQLETEDLVRHELEVAQLESKLCDFAWRMGGRRASKKSDT